MTGRITQSEGWMNYHLHIDGQDKPKRIYWRNHHNSYIKQDGRWVQVFFNQYILDTGSYAEIPMWIDEEGEWSMQHAYEQTSDPGAVYAIVEDS